MMRRYVAWVAILLLTCYLVLVGGGWAGLYESSLRTASVALAAGVLLAWVSVAWRSPEWRPRSVLLPAIVASIGSLAVSTVFSRFPRQSVEYLGYAIILAALYLLLVRILASPFLRTRIVTLVTGLCAVLATAYVAVVVLHWIDWWGLVGRMALPPLRPAFESLTFGNPAAVMTVTVLLLASTAAGIGVASMPRAVGMVVLAVPVAVTVVLSGSRAGWLAVSVAVLATIVLWLLTSAGRRQARVAVRRIVGTTTGRASVVIGTVIVAAVAFALSPGIVGRFWAGGIDLRTSYLASAWRMFTDAPVLGTGPGTWVVQRIRYTASPDPDYYIPHAHNIYAQTLAELGIVGAAAGVILIASLAWLAWNAVRGSDTVRRRWGWAAAFVLLYFGSHQLLDFYANMPAALFAAALPFAWLDATSPAQASSAWAPRLARLPRATPTFGAAAVVIACSGLLASESVAGQHAAAVEAYNDGDWARARALAEDAVARDPAWPPYEFTLGLAAAAEGDSQSAADAFRRTANADDLPEAWLDLAAAEHALGNTDAALDALTRATRLGLQRPAISMAIGDLASRLGRPDLADAAFAEALRKLPSLAGDPWWRADPARAARYPEILADAIAGADVESKWMIALSDGDIELARSLVPRPSYPPGGFDPYAVIMAWAGDDTALARVLETCHLQATNSTAMDWCARLLARAGDELAANRYREISYLLLGDSAGPFEVRVSDGPVVGRQVAGDVAEFYGTYTYRRPTPWNPLVSDLVQLILK